MKRERDAIFKSLLEELVWGSYLENQRPGDYRHLTGFSLLREDVNFPFTLTCLAFFIFLSLPGFKNYFFVKISCLELVTLFFFLLWMEFLLYILTWCSNAIGLCWFILYSEPWLFHFLQFVVFVDFPKYRNNNVTGTLARASTIRKQLYPVPVI